MVWIGSTQTLSSQTRSKSSGTEIVHLTFTTILVVAIGLSFTN